MLEVKAIAEKVLAELSTLKREAHWGEFELRVSLKNGDPHQVSVSVTRTFRDLPPPTPAAR